MAIKPNPTLAPEYNQHRELLTAHDIVASVVKAQGMNMSGNKYANIQVVPSADANPTVQVYWWSESAGEFAQEHTPITKAGVGVNVPYEFTVECRGRVMFVAITAGNNLASNLTKVFVSGYELSPH